MKRLRDRFVALLLIVGWSFVPVSADERPALEIATLTQTQIDLLIDSLRSSARLTLPPSKASQVVDANTSGIWAGSKTKVSLAMSEVTLRFRRKLEELVAAAQSGKDLTYDLLESFDVTVKADLSRMGMRHSNPERAFDAQGVWVSTYTTKPQTLVPFVSGQKDSGVYAAILPTANRDNQWAMYVCPRKVVRDRRTAAVSLMPSLYELFEAKVEVSAEAEAIMSTGGQEGKVKLSMSLTKDLPPSGLAEDESISAVPRAALKYKPQTPFDFFKFKPHADVQQGVQVAVEMQNKVGYIRRQFFRRSLYLHKSEEQTGVPVYVDNRRAVTDSGECYVVVEMASAWTEYDKGPAAF
jgi:hypothetical protein